MCNLKTTVKVAGHVLEAIQAYHRQEDPLARGRRSVVTKLEDLVRLCRKLEKCRGRFPLARQRLGRELVQTVSDTRLYLENFSRRCASRHRLPSLRELVGELQALQAEFGGWSFDPKGSALAVETEPIELEGVFLGPFQVRLDLDELLSADGRPLYRVIALDPHPPSCNESVTHPHVRDEHLCEGEAGVAIGAAALEGRLCDLFLLVASVLRTYNPGSPHVKLEDWEGVPCYDCGRMVEEGYRIQCESCENDFCNDCVSSCVSCGFTACHSCLGACDLCAQQICDGCRVKCDKCGETYCDSCVKDGLCDRCKEEADEKTQVEETCA